MTFDCFGPWAFGFMVGIAVMGLTAAYIIRGAESISNYHGEGAATMTREEARQELVEEGLIYIGPAAIMERWIDERHARRAAEARVKKLEKLVKIAHREACGPDCDKEHYCQAPTLRDAFRKPRL